MSIRIKKYLSRSCLEIIIHAFNCVQVSSKLNYYNDVSKCTLPKLQCIQNTVAQLRIFTKKSAQIILVLIDFAWLPLPVQYCIKIKIVLIIVYKGINDLALPYLKQLLHHHPSQCKLSLHYLEWVATYSNLRKCASLNIFLKFLTIKECYYYCLINEQKYFNTIYTVILLLSVCHVVIL